MKRLIAFACLWLVTGGAAHSQVYNYFSAGCALSGNATSQTVNLASGACVIGTLAAAQEPAHTGDATNVAGSLALSVVKVNGLAVPISAYVLGSNGSGQLVSASVFKQAGVSATCNSGGCTVNTAYNVASVTRSGVGQYNINFSGGTFSTSAICVAFGSSSNLAGFGTEGSNTSVEIYLYSLSGGTPALVDTSFAAICMGS
jgi:hypothetical protein